MLEVGALLEYEGPNENFAGLTWEVMAKSHRSWGLFCQLRGAGEGFTQYVFWADVSEPGWAVVEP